MATTTPPRSPSATRCSPRLLAEAARLVSNIECELGWDRLAAERGELYATDLRDQSSLRIFSEDDWAPSIIHPWTDDSRPTDGELVYSIGRMHPKQIELVRMRSQDGRSWQGERLGLPTFGPDGSLLVPEGVKHTKNFIDGYIVQRSPGVDVVIRLMMDHWQSVINSNLKLTQLEASLTRIFKAVKE